MNPEITEFKQLNQKVVFSLKEDLKSIRTGKANPSILENVIVEAYGGQTKLRLMELSSITTEGTSVLAVHPFDPSTIGDIEKAILKSPLGLSPSPQGNRLLVKIPPLSQEQREKLVKLVSQKVEEKKNYIRNNRDEIRKKFKVKMDAKEISEDEKFRLEKEIDSITRTVMDEMQAIKDSKETEIREI